ncbi:MAG: maltose ABC transporter substrate-binding protein [Propionibacteriaceae bacterium]|nr:maltose ABC transporter substrate-binding protein [Propionibacteriaceae bacterium]
MRKHFFALAAASLALTMTACGGAAEPAATTSTDTTAGAETSAPMEAAGTLTLWADENRVDSFNALGEKFLAQTGITLDVVEKPTGDVKTDFIAQVPTGEGPDLIVGAHDWVGDLVKNGVIAPVELGDKTAGLSDISMQAFTMEGSLYGVPYAIENIALVRNNKLAPDTPATLDELIAQGVASGAEFPILIQQGAEGDAYHLYPIQTSFGAPVFMTGDNGEYTAELGMGGENGAKFAEYLKKLSGEGVLSASIGGDQAKQAFLDGKSPYMITGPWNIADFETAGIDFAVLPVPSAGGQPSQPFLGVQGVYLSSKSENALLANQFLDYMTSAEAQTTMYELAGRTPALTESADAVDDEILAGFGEAGKDGQPMPSIPEMGAVWTFWGAAQISIIDGSATDPAAAWATMVTNIESAF